jgi:hypothetical protein
MTRTVVSQDAPPLYRSADRPGPMGHSSANVLLPCARRPAASDGCFRPLAAVDGGGSRDLLAQSGELPLLARRPALPSTSVV